MPVIQIGEVGDGTFKNIPVGEKLVASVFDIEKVAVKSGDNAGQPQFVVTWKVTEGEFKGREIRYYNVPLYAAKNAWVLNAFAEAVGWPVERDEKNRVSVDVPDNFKSVLGTEALVTIGERQSQSVGEDGQPRMFNTVTRVAKASTGEGEKPVAKKASWSDV